MLQACCRRVARVLHACGRHVAGVLLIVDSSPPDLICGTLLLADAKRSLRKRALTLASSPAGDQGLRDNTRRVSLVYSSLV